MAKEDIDAVYNKMTAGRAVVPAILPSTVSLETTPYML